MFVRYHPKVNDTSVHPYDDFEYDYESHTPSYCQWIVPGTVDPLDD